MPMEFRMRASWAKHVRAWVLAIGALGCGDAARDQDGERDDLTAPEDRDAARDDDRDPRDGGEPGEGLDAGPTRDGGGTQDPSPDASDSTDSSLDPDPVTDAEVEEPPDGMQDAEVPDDPDPVTYRGDVWPIFEWHCYGCHRIGGIGPFPIDDYSTARFNAGAIAAATAARIMPPCDLIGDPCGLSNEEIALIGAWASGGALEGVAGGGD